MKINEVTRETGLSRRAVKYYEEEGLLSVKKDQNGYRNYSSENLKTLREISAYRKLGIGIKEIKRLLQRGDREILRQIYEEKRKQLGENQRELEALAAYIENESTLFRRSWIMRPSQTLSEIWFRGFMGITSCIIFCPICRSK